jgi:hypothetical protein
MYEDNWQDEVAAHRETEIAEEAFQRATDDHAQAASSEARWSDGLVPTEVDEQPDFIWRNPRVSERTDLENGRQVYTILCDDGQEVELKALIAKLNKKLAKWGQTIEITAEEEVFKQHWLLKGAWLASAQEVNDSPEVIARREQRGDRRETVRQVRLTIESPAVAGKKAKLIGAFELAEDGESVYRHALNGATEADIEPFLARWQDCDHCGFKRDRRASFVCEAEDGQRVVIGRQCSRDFLGLDAAELLAREAIRKSLSAGGEEEESTGGWGSHYIHVPSLVLKAYLVAKRLGGYSRDTSDVFKDHVAALEGAKDYGRSTHYRDLRRDYEAWLEKVKPEPMNFAEFADYVYGTTGDFGQNLQIAFSCEYAKPKRRNLILAGVGLYIGRLLKQVREVEDDARKGRPPAKLLAGAEKDRVDFEGEVERCFPLPSDFGPKTLIAIVADDGSRCVHISTSEVKPEAGRRYAIRATIKRHGTNRKFGTPETTITRAVYSDPSTQQPLI